MFEGAKYMTRGVQSQISLDLQLMMWRMIEELKDKEISMDYLQVFKLTRITKDNSVLQQVKHEQEIPFYVTTITVAVDEAVDTRLFVISLQDENDREYSTMMLAEELLSKGAIY